MKPLDDDPALRHADRGGASAGPDTGRVWLVGAGPGDPELLTLKALRRLQRATLVLHDHLVAPEILALLPPAATCIDVGHDLVRLKGGDPYIFGRGGEEAQALAAAGIPFEVIPGLSAAQAAAAGAGIPLTHRDHATAVVFVTGHGRADAAPPGGAPGSELDPTAPEVDWAALARPHQTLVIYMGLGRLAALSAGLVRHGLSPLTPAALIERASRPDQRCVTGTLQTLPALAERHAVRAPALIVVGSVVSLHATLAGGSGPE